MISDWVRRRNNAIALPRAACRRALTSIAISPGIKPYPRQEGRERVAVQKARLSERRNQPGRGDAEGLLRVLERSLRLKIQYRDLLIKELMRWPTYR